MRETDATICPGPSGDDLSAYHRGAPSRRSHRTAWTIGHGSTVQVVAQRLRRAVRCDLAETTAARRPLRHSRPRPAPRTCPAAPLDVHPRDGARDHELLDLGGALEDVIDRPADGITEPFGLPVPKSLLWSPAESGRIRTRLARDLRATAQPSHAPDRRFVLRVAGRASSAGRSCAMQGWATVLAPKPRGRFGSATDELFPLLCPGFA
jgi:hypothetical protein